MRATNKNLLPYTAGMTSGINVTSIYEFQIMR